VQFPTETLFEGKNTFEEAFFLMLDGEVELSKIIKKL